MGRYFWKITLIGSLLLSSISPTRAMTISESLMNDDVHIIKLQGKIEQGDFVRVQNVIAKADRDNKRRLVVSIDSGGGNVNEGARISDLIYRAKLPVAVHRDCESSCFMIFAAASVRLVGPDTRIGVHSANYNGQETDGAMATTVQMVRLYKEYKVPTNIIGQAVTYPPDDMYYLTAADLTAMGANIAK